MKIGYFKKCLDSYRLDNPKTPRSEMNYYLLISGILTIIMGIAHSIMGEMLILRHLKNSQDLPAVRGSIRTTKLTLRFAWHVTTVLGFGMAIILIYYSGFKQFSPDQIFVLRVLSLTNFISFIVSIVGSRAGHPSWIVFIMVAVLIWLGIRHYSSFWEAANESAFSRFLGGIHTTKVNEVAKQEGKKVGENINSLQWTK